MNTTLLRLVLGNFHNVLHFVLMSLLIGNSSALDSPVGVIERSANVILGNGTESATISCSLNTAAHTVNGNVWLRNGREMPDTEVNSSKHFMNYTVSNLMDAGVYTCVFKGPDQVNTTIIVQGPPVLSKHKRMYTSVYVGSKVQLHCVLGLHGFPPVSWSWMKLNGTAFDKIENQTHATVTRTDGHSVLLLHSVQLIDAGEYRCEARNSAGTAHFVQILRVHSMRAALWPFLAIVAEVLLLCSIIIGCEQLHKSRSEKQEELKEN
uniref:Ig-like domain-containing protein n=1 Tax=Eptatretus burgeri TaxID=7764 RepID=A0A8C4QH99_EPTBU